MPVADIARQFTAARAGKDRLDTHQHRRGAAPHWHSGFFDLPLDPPRGWPMGLLLGVADPGGRLSAATPVNRYGEGPEFGDVKVATFRRLVAQCHIGLASHQICPLPQLIDQFYGDARW